MRLAVDRGSHLQMGDFSDHHNGWHDFLHDRRRISIDTIFAPHETELSESFSQFASRLPEGAGSLVLTRFSRSATLPSG